jgi:PadR family transcriptional regulator, regulatory protein PadR
MAKSDSLLGTLDLLILKILSRRPGLHGYLIMTAIAEISDDILRAEQGSLYPALRRLEEAGLVRAAWLEKENGRRTRTYRLTQAGCKQLEAEESRWRTVSTAVNRVLRLA